MPDKVEKNEKYGCVNATVHTVEKSILDILNGGGKIVWVLEYLNVGPVEYDYKIFVDYGV